MNGRGAPTARTVNALGTLLAWVAIGWGVGVWRHWWLLGPKSIGIALVIALAFVVAARARLSSPLPTAERVHAEIQGLTNAGQQRQLRHLFYQVAGAWPSERGDDDPWTGVKFFIDPVGLILRVGVSAILDEENRTPALVQAYAKHHYENQLGANVVRNEITNFAGHWCVVTDAIHPNGGRVRRYSFTLHLSEYVVQFTCVTEAHFAICEPLMDAVVQLCRLEIPRVVDRSVLGGRVLIGVPADWTETTDEDRRAAWRAMPGPLDVSLHLLDEGGHLQVNETVFERVPGYERRQGSVFRKIRMDENGASGLRLIWSPPARPNSMELVMDAVRLPSGLVVVLATRNHGRGDEKMQGFLIDAMRLELLASLRPGDAPIL